MAIDVSKIRKLVQNRLAEVKRAAAARRERVAAAERDYAVFVPAIATPVLNAIAQALSAEGYPYRVTTPGDGIRLVSERSSRTHIDLRLDTAAADPVIMVEVARERGHRVLVDERVFGEGQPISGLTEDDLSVFIVQQVGELIER